MPATVGRETKWMSAVLCGQSVGSQDEVGVVVDSLDQMLQAVMVKTFPLW